MTENYPADLMEVLYIEFQHNFRTGLWYSWKSPFLTLGKQYVFMDYYGLKSERSDNF
jgi:hypothetical protein